MINRKKAEQFANHLTGRKLCKDDFYDKDNGTCCVLGEAAKYFLDYNNDDLMIADIDDLAKSFACNAELNCTEEEFVSTISKMPDVNDGAPEESRSYVVREYWLEHIVPLLK